MHQNPSSGWSDVDGTGDSQHFINYLSEITALEYFQIFKLETFRMLHAYTGHHILDVGRGTGDDVVALARMDARFETA